MNEEILVINGSAREGGNTDALIQKIIEGAHDEKTTISDFKLREHTIGQCIGCYTCKEDDRCKLPDDMNDIRQHLEQSKIIIFASPNYWCEVTGLMKTFIDRLYYYHHTRHGGLIAGKRAIILITMGESTNIEYENEVMVEFYRRAFKSLNIDILDILIFSDIMEADAVLKKPDYLDRAYKVGKSLKTKLKFS